MPKLKSIKKTIIYIVACCLISGNLAAKTLVKEIEFTEDGKLEISLSAKNDFQIFTLKNPNRLVIDLPNSKFANQNYYPKLPQIFRNFRKKEDDKKLRIVFDLAKEVKPKNSTFDAKRNKIVSDLGAEAAGFGKSNSNDFINQKVEEFEVQTTKIQNADGTSKYIVTKSRKAFKKPVIVIDAGHGGKDPGTIGNYLRTKEKNITLSYAKELGKYLVNTGKYKVYLTRDTDKFIPLFERVEIARRKKADLFISIHANSAEDNDVSGFSIYTLSEKASDKRAQLLANKENRADIIHGVDFSGASYDIMKTLIDLSQRQSKNSSAVFANMAVRATKKSGIEILQNSHRFAGFAVLTAPDMASTLIEIGYLSSRDEEKLLNSLSYKRKVAESLAKAIDEFFAKNKI